MFIPFTPHDWLRSFRENPLSPRGERLVFMAPPKKVGSSGAGAGDPVVAAAREALDEEDLGGERNQEWVDKLDRLMARDALNRETTTEAKTALSSNNKHIKTLAHQLADQEIDQELFGIGLDALKGGNQSSKALARRMVDKKISGEAFESALDDLEGGDAYLKPLARRLAIGQINSEEYDTARVVLRDEDPDKKWAAQMFSKGVMSPYDFRQKMDMAARTDRAETRAEDSADPVAKIREDIHEKIAELLLSVDVVMEQLPEQERTRPLQKLRQNLVKLNQKDRTNHNALVGYLHRMQEDQGLQSDDMAMILDFDADTKEDFERFGTALLATGLKESAISNILKLKKEEWAIEKDFLQQTRITGEIMKSAVNMIHYETLKDRMLENASLQSGIKIKEGTQIQYTYPDPKTANIRTRTIKKVEVRDAPILDRIDGNVIGRQPADVTIYLDNGEKYTLGRFMKWVNAADIHENIKNQVDLEQKLELPQVGMRLKSGQDMEFTTGYSRNKTGDLVSNRDSVQIESIDDEKVVFSKPVVTLKAEEDPNARLEVPRMAREMNLGEFAKWARRNDATPHIKNLDELRENLRNQNTFMNQTWSRKPEEWPPITVQPGEVVQFGADKNKQFLIEKVNDDGIQFKDGTRMTLPQFLGWVRNNHAERATPADEAKREEKAAARLGEIIDESAKTGFLKKAMDAFTKKSEPTQGNKTSDVPKKETKGFFDSIKPFFEQEDKQYGAFRIFMSQYTFLSVKDIINMGKELIEFIKRKHTRRSKHRYSLVGQTLPDGLGTEFSRVNQAAETEEMNMYKEAMTQWGTWQILDKLHSTNSKDEAKACFIVLAEKGELRWDDMEIWKTLNRVTAAYTPSGKQLYIHITRKKQVNPKTGIEMSGEDRTKDSIDALYGEGQWAEWFSKNISAYNNAKNAYEFKGKQLEGDPKGTGGLPGELARLLKEWKKGSYVNPHEYEELIDFGIKFGKMTAEGKLFYLMEGLSARCPSGAQQGQTLLHIDRIGELDGKYLNQFPLLDFFTNKGEKPFHPKYLNGEVPEPPKGGYQAEDYAEFIKAYFPEESEKSEAGKNFSKFLWEQMIVDPNFRKRLAKGLRRAENMDHDDAHLYIPTANIEQIETFTGSQTGNQKYWTDEGYKNAYAGFNQYTISLTNRYEALTKLKEENKPISPGIFQETESQIMQAVQSYFLFDAVLSGRRDKRNDSKARLGVNQFEDTPVVDDTFRVREHKEQLDNMVRAICDAYGIDWKELDLYTETKWEENKKQEEIKAKMQNFLTFVLPEAIKAQGAGKMIKVITDRKMRAVQNPKDPNTLRGIIKSNALLQNTSAAGEEN